MLITLVGLFLPGCGAKPPPPTAPIRTHLEDAAALLPPVARAAPWRRFTFNDWERLRARAGLGETPEAQWTADAHRDAAKTLQMWLLPPGTPAAAAMLAPLGVDGATIRWQAALDGPDDRPITRLVTAAAREERPIQTGVALVPLGYQPAPGAAATVASPNLPARFQRATNASGTLPPLLDDDAAALFVTPTTLLSVHDTSRVAEAQGIFAPNGATLETVPFFHGLIAGINDIEALAIFRCGANGYRDASAPALDAPYLPFDALGAALHITDAGAQYVTLAFHLTALPGGRLPEGMAEWWATRFGLDRPDPRAEYLEAFGDDGWLFARYRIRSGDERLGGVPRGEVPFWQSVTTWQSIRQRWAGFAPRSADPIPRLGT